MSAQAQLYVLVGTAATGNESFCDGNEPYAAFLRLTEDGMDRLAKVVNWLTTCPDPDIPTMAGFRDGHALALRPVTAVPDTEGDPASTEFDPSMTKLFLLRRPEGVVWELSAAWSEEGHGSAEIYAYTVLSLKQQQAIRRAFSDPRVLSQAKKHAILEIEVNHADPDRPIALSPHALYDPQEVDEVPDTFSVVYGDDDHLSLVERYLAATAQHSLEEDIDEIAAQIRAVELKRQIGAVGARVARTALKSTTEATDDPGHDLGL